MDGEEDFEAADILSQLRKELKVTKAINPLATFQEEIPQKVSTPKKSTKKVSVEKTPKKSTKKVSVEKTPKKSTKKSVKENKPSATIAGYEKSKIEDGTYTVEILKQIAKNLNLKVSGKKADLIERILKSH
jgi:hypothetical protein